MELRQQERRVGEKVQTETYPFETFTWFLVRECGIKVFVTVFKMGNVIICVCVDLNLL